MTIIAMGVLDIIFPRKCFGCGKEGRYLCRACLEKIEIPKPICPMCEKPAIDGRTHFGCKKPFGLDGLLSLWLYDGAVKKAILALKYKFASDIAKELAQRTLERILDTPLLPSEATLVSIPLHVQRENWRGFNQAEEIGKDIAGGMKYRFEPDLLVRKRLTSPQAGLTAEKRSKNIRGVFALNPRYQPLAITHKPLIIFDDVWTTGSTLKEAGKVLKRGGVKEVWGLTLAK